MGLRNLTFPGLSVEVPGGGSFTVQGFNEDALVSIYHRHAGQLSALFDQVVALARQQDGSTVDAERVIMSLLSDAPEIMGEIIAVVSGSRATDTFVEPDVELNPLGLTDWERDIAAARKLPTPVKVDALMKAASLTFTSSMPPGEFWAVIIRMLGETTAALTPPNG